MTRARYGEFGDEKPTYSDLGLPTPVQPWDGDPQNAPDGCPECGTDHQPGEFCPAEDDDDDDGLCPHGVPIEFCGNCHEEAASFTPTTTPTTEPF